MAKKKLNQIIVKGNTAKIIINSSKYGRREALINANDIDKVKNYTWYVNYCPSTNNFYVKTSIHKEEIYTMVGLHRLIMDCSSDLLVDHINHNTLDNRKENLRIVTHKQNAENKKGAYKSSKSGVLGVRWHKRDKKWSAQVRHNKKDIHLGYFNNIEEAKKATIKARKQLFTHNII